MTELVWTTNGSGSTRNAVGFYYTSFPPTGNNTVTVTTGGGGTKYAVLGGSVIYENVLSVANVGNVASLSVDVNDSVIGTQLLAVAVNASSIDNGSKNEMYSNGSSVTGSGDYGLIQSSVGTGGTVNFTMDGSSSVQMTQVMQINPNRYNRDFLQMFFN